MSELDPRKQTILQAVVIEYIAGAEPVASEQLVQKYQLGVKSATVRNEMAEMSELGFLEQPHTSAGRVPSDMGYRYYVDRLIVKRELDDITKNRVRAASDDGEALQLLLRDTTRVLSRLTLLLGVATTMRDQNVTVRHAVVSALGPAQALLVLILSNGHLENKMLECPVGLTLEDVGRANEQLASLIVGKPLKSLARAKMAASGSNPAVDKLMQTIWTAVRSTARDLTRGLLITEGEEFMFAQPEFQKDFTTLNDLLTELVEGDVLYEAVSPSDGAQVVTIGRENRDERMRAFSVVRTSYFVGDQEAGVIALIGPTRMRYEQSIPMVNFTAKALSDSLSRFFG
jgi:heat-inducible transcriptional repressor